MKVYKYDTETKEFLQEIEISEQYGINLPFTTTVKPLTKKEDFAICFNGTKWEYIEDNRNTVVYNKETKQESRIDYLGAIKDDVTTLKPEQFDKWDYETNSWVCDEVEKEKARVQSINSYTQSFITKKYPLEKQSSANLGIYGDEYKNEMIKFISNCINLSNVAIEKNTNFEDFKAELDN
jgi:hypothetical protein